MAMGVVINISLWEAKTALPRNPTGSLQPIPFNRRFLSTYYALAASTPSTLCRVQTARSKADPTRDL